MNLWLDDKRPMPRGFDVHTISAHHAAKLIRCGLVDMVSLDHDLGDEAIYGTGYVVAKAIEELAHAGKIKRRLTIAFHTQNPVGRTNMQAAIASAAAVCDRLTVLPL